MTTKTAIPMNPKIGYAAQNARLGLINANDLSLLVGVEAPLLNSFAKKGMMVHYGEYHGKRFFNFEELVNWLHEAGDQGEAHPIIRNAMEAMMQNENCPYSLEKIEEAGTSRVRIVWKEMAEAA